MKSHYIKGIIIAVLMIYPVLELTRIILSYLSGGYWVVSPSIFEIIVEQKPFSEWSYIFEIFFIWFSYFIIIYLTIKWDKKIFIKKEKAT